MFASITALAAVHMGQKNGRGPSPRLWACVNGQELAPDGYSNGRYAGDNFLNFGALEPATAGSTSYGAHGGYGAYLDTATSASSIKQRADDFGGIRLAAGAVDNHEAWLASGGNTGALGKVSDDDDAPRLLIFEASVALGQIGDNGGACFVGLSAPGGAAANRKADNTGVLGAGACIGFDTVHSDGDSVNFVYRSAAGAQKVLASGIAIPKVGEQLKLGFVFDPKSCGSQRIRIFVNNAEAIDKVTSKQLSDADFPSSEWLGFLAGVKNGTATASSLDCHWWHFFQAG